MVFRTLICGCLIFGLSTAAPQRLDANINVNRQFDRTNRPFDGDRQFDSGNQQFDGGNRQFNGGNRQVAGGNSQTFTSGRQTDDSRNAYITKYDYDNDGSGRYVYDVSQSDGIYNDQTGEIENEGTDAESSRVYGHYGYYGPDGNFYYVEYVADKYGFRPAGQHIPRAASVGRVGQLGIPSAAIASLAGGGLG